MSRLLSFVRRRLGVTPYRLAGRSPPPSRLRLTRICLRCAIHGFAGQIRRLNGRGNPSPPVLVGAMNFWRRRSVGTRRRRESLRTISRQGRRRGSSPADGGRPRDVRHDAETFREDGFEHAYRRLRMRVIVPCPNVKREGVGNPEPARLLMQRQAGPLSLRQIIQGNSDPERVSAAASLEGRPNRVTAGRHLRHLRRWPPPPSPR